MSKVLRMMRFIVMAKKNHVSYRLKTATKKSFYIGFILYVKKQSDDEKLPGKNKVTAQHQFKY